ncbi:MAG: hypothetical protein AB8G05_05660 [Oligoflexales bacterium]
MNIYGLLFTLSLLASTVMSMSLPDSTSIVYDGDDRYSVVCSDGTRESVTEDDILSNNICPFLEHSRPDDLVVPGADVYLKAAYGDNPVSKKLGDESWFNNSLVSFKMKVSAENWAYNPWIKILDGNGASWVYRGDEDVSFHSLVGPVSIHLDRNSGHSSSNYDIAVQITDVSYKIPDTKSITLTENNAIKYRILQSIGGSTPGMHVSFQVKLDIFDNYECELACTQITFKSDDNKKISLNEGAKTKFIRLKSPIEVITDPLCMSSKKQEPENDKFDYKLELSKFQVHKN